VRTPLLILREISGAGYWGSGILTIACIIGLRSRLLERRYKQLLFLTIAGPIAGALIADALFDYFIAIRQMIFALPGIVLLASEGFHTVYRRRSIAGLCFAGSLLGVALWYDVRWFQRPREDWQAAASQLSSEAGTSCILPIPARVLRAYEFFQPELGEHVCPAGLEQSRSVVIAQSPYASEREIQRESTRLSSFGLELASESAAGGTRIQRYEMPSQ
jgi:MFS family permease